MTTCSRGDVVLVGFVFADESGRKLRPALVVSSGRYHEGRQEVVVAAITSNVRRRLFGDHLVGRWKEAGLLLPSIVTGILRTVRRAMIERRLGILPRGDIEAVNRALRRSLAL
jgi:mRNA-degrading endonuclease toxin of MazEF toxin-antitoxin module